MKLFRDEIYQTMERKLQQPSDFNGIEEALDMIRGDQELQKFLRDYAIKNKIERKGWAQYGHGDPLSFDFVRYEILLWEKKADDSPLNGSFLTIHPDTSEETAPIFYNYLYEARHGAGYYTDYRGSLKVVRREDAYYLEDDPEEDKHSHLHDTRLIDLGIFTKVTKKEILNGLEKAITKILN